MNKKRNCSVVKIMVIILSELIGMLIGAVGVGKLISKQIEEKKRMSDKHLALFLMMDQWVKIKQEGKCLSEFFEENGYFRIAVYGMSYVGETFVKEMEMSDVKVLYGIDKNANKICSDIEVFSMEETLEQVDAIVVTPITFFDEISQALSEKVECPIISLEDVLYAIKQNGD